MRVQERSGDRPSLSGGELASWGTQLAKTDAEHHDGEKSREVVRQASSSRSIASSSLYFG